MKRNNEYDVVELTSYLDNVNLDRFYEKILITRRSIVRVYPPQPKDKYLQFQRLWVFFYACKLVAIMLKNGDIMLNWVKIG